MLTPLLMGVGNNERDMAKVDRILEGIDDLIIYYTTVGFQSLATAMEKLDNLTALLNENKEMFRDSDDWMSRGLKDEKEKFCAREASLKTDMRNLFISIKSGHSSYADSRLDKIAELKRDIENYVDKFKWAEDKVKLKSI